MEEQTFSHTTEVQILRLSIRLGVVLLLSVIFFSLTLPILAAGPGDLDTSFGKGGVVTTTVGSSSGIGGIAIQPDGKIVVVGDGNLNTLFGVARYNNYGILDHNFGNNGVVTTAIGISAYGTHAAAIGLQPDSKIVVAGTSSNGSEDMFALTRYTTTGDLDNNFGSNGIITTPIGIEANGRAIALQPDGKIIVAGDSFDGSQSTIALARYTVTGTLDSDFGSSGVVTTLIDSDAFANAVALQPVDDKIVVAGSSGNRHSQSYFALARFTITGTLDADFGNGGVITTPIGTYGSCYGIALQSDDKIVVVGHSIYGSSPPAFLALARYNNNGDLDSVFGNNGVVTTSIGCETYGTAVTVDPDGKIVVAGFSEYSLGVRTFALIRYDSNGGLDSGFGKQGAITTPISSIASANAVIIQPDNKIVVAGTSFDGVQNSYALARYISTESVYLPVILK